MRIKKSAAKNIDSTFNPFGDRGSTYRPRKTMSDRLTSWRRTMLAIVVIVIVLIAAGTPAFIHSLRSNAMTSIDKVNSTVEAVRQSAGSERVHQAVNSALKDTTDPNIKAALQPLSITSTDQLPEAHIDQDMDNTAAGVAVAPYFILCDIANNIHDLASSTLGTLCTQLTTQVTDMITKVKRYNTMVNSFVGGMVPGSKPLPDVNAG